MPQEYHKGVINLDVKNYLIVCRTTWYDLRTFFTSIILFRVLGRLEGGIIGWCKSSFTGTIYFTKETVTP